MIKRLNKKGSVTVFLMSILITMIMASLVFVHATRSVAGASYSDAVLELAGRSVLAEFDRRLKDEYGIFAFNGNEGVVAHRINLYASASFDKRIPNEIPWRQGRITDLLRLDLQKINVEIAQYSLMDVDVFEEQISNYMNYLLVQMGIDFIRSMWSKGEAGSGGNNNSSGNTQSEDKVLRNDAEIQSLPSAGRAQNGINIASVVANGIPSIDRIFDQGTMNFKTNEYILSHFKYRVGGNKEKVTFFENEVEYIIYGRMSDRENLRAFRTDFLLLRTPLNLAHILSDSQKRGQAQALANTFGPKAPIAFAVIVAAWSLAEAENDARRLLDGKNVALIKTNRQWALTLANAINVTATTDEEGEIVDVNASPRNSAGYISPELDTGFSYADYLRLFLFLERRETKLLRTMDLIQLNFRGSYYEDFLIKEHYTGFSLSAVVSGKRFDYEQKY